MNFIQEDLPKNTSILNQTKAKSSTLIKQGNTSIKNQKSIQTPESQVKVTLRSIIRKLVLLKHQLLIPQNLSFDPKDNPLMKNEEILEPNFKTTQ